MEDHKTYEQLHAENDSLRHTVHELKQKLLPGFASALPTSICSEELLSTVIESSPDIIIVKDGNGRWLRANKKAQTIFGLQETDFIGKNEIQIASVKPFFKESFRICRETDEKTWHNRKASTFEETLHVNDGTKHIFEIKKIPIFNEDGSRKQLLLLGRDVSNHKQIESNLEITKEKFKHAFTASNIGIGLINIDGIFLEANPTLEDILQHDANGLSGKSLYSLLTEHDKRYMSQQCELLLKTQLTSVQQEVQFIFGTKITWGRISLSLISNIHEPLPYFIIQVFDITAQKRNEELLRESEDRYRTLASATHEAVLIFSEYGVIDANELALRMFGYSADEIVDLTIAELIDQPFESIIKDNLELNHTYSYQVAAKKKGGEIFPVEFFGKRLVYKGVPSILTTCRDLTQQKKYEKELIVAKEMAERSDKLKSAFLANMSHEIRTPMNGIIGFAEMLRDASLSSDKRNELIETINQSSHSLLQIVNDIVDISKIESGLISLNNESFSVNKLLKELHCFHEQSAMHRSIGLNISACLEDEFDIIEGDRTKVFQVLNNLLSNALKFTFQGFVSFGAKKIDDKLILFVKDTGVGIAKEFHKDIFKRFTQEETNLVKLAGGTGLGLAICDGYIKLMNGSISVESEKSQGTQFTCEIPYKVSSFAKVKKKSDSQIVTKSVSLLENKATILIVEDEIVNYRYLELLFSKTAATIHHADTGESAIRFCSNNPMPDIILMDVKLPDIDGYEASRRIRDIYPQVKIVAQTAFALNEERQSKLNHLFDGYETKPIDKKSLFLTIDSLLISSTR